jgi:cellulose synthase/poly-beta-1,6-N-acetylglucosamine synthase-like glycosyltransferase
MDFSLLTGVRPLLLLLVADALLLVFMAYPLKARYDDDQGDGLALVLLPRPKLPSYWRVPAFGLLFLLLMVGYHSIRGSWTPDQAYADLVTRISLSVVRSPAEVGGYMSGFTLGLRFLAFGTILCIAVVGRGNAPRRALVALQAFIYLGVMAFIDATLVVVEVLVGAPVAPTTLFGNFAAVGLAVLALTRMEYLNYALPKPSAVPFAKRPRMSDALTLLGVTVAAMAICMAALLWIYHAADPAYRPALGLLLPVPFAEGSFIVRSMLLSVVNGFSVRPDPPVGDYQPPIDVIIPAYNEEEVIAPTLDAIDVAASRYGGPVRVVLMNDGSTDRTRELALAAMGRFRHATGEVHDGRHGGKSETLNAALKLAESDIVVRIDADTVIGEWSLYYTPRWFEDPQIGLVEPMCFPRATDRRSVFPYMRLFEELKQFGLNHRTIQTVDGVNVVPGVFTAFRRQVAVGLGGFTVGMNGEDGDFTLRFSRLGYRMWMDTRIIVYEDVPPTYSEIREQRVRWGRAVHHNQSRHGPYRAGVATPKVWFNQTQQFVKCAFAPARLLLPMYLLLTAAFEGTQRNVILIFLGGYVLAEIVFMALQALLTVGYRQIRHFGWVLLWPMWHEFLLVFATEAWLSMPGRPLGLHGTRPLRITHAVIH